MIYKAIPIDNYYIIVSDEDIKSKDIILNIPHMKVYPITNEFIDEFINGGDCKKILFQNKPIHPGVPLFDAPWEVDVEGMAHEYAERHAFRVPYDGSNNFYDDKDYKCSEEGYKAGYLKHSETHKFTLEDMEKAFYAGRAKDQVLLSGEVKYYTFNSLLQSLQKPKSYEVELEMEDGKPKLVNNKPVIKSWNPIN